MPEAPSPPPMLDAADVDRIRTVYDLATRAEPLAESLRDLTAPLHGGGHTAYPVQCQTMALVGAIDAMLASTRCVRDLARGIGRAAGFRADVPAGGAPPLAAAAGPRLAALAVEAWAELEELLCGDAPRPAVADAATGSEDDAAADQGELRRDLAEYDAAVADGRAPTDDEIDGAALDAALTEAVLGAMEDATGHVRVESCS